MATARKVILLILDSVGVGAMPDAAEFLDTGANTLSNTAAHCGGLNLPVLGKLGLGNITQVAGVPPVPAAMASWGRLQEASAAKDTVTGHWELAGHISENPFAIFEEGFPAAIMEPFAAKSGHSWIVNRAYSGTDVLNDYGAEHMASGALIVYTSADSVFQIAAHEDVVPLEELYRICRIAREVLDDHHMARVIARPFVGEPGNFQRTYNRKDFCMEPPGNTVLDLVTKAGNPVYGVGKIEDIFAGRGVTSNVHTEGNDDGMKQTLAIHRTMDPGLLFVNLVDFDMLYGHRRNPEGYGRALEEADVAIGRLLEQMGREDVLIITADHGCDPTHAGHTDHTREYVPALLYGSGIPAGKQLGTRSSFADVGATIAGLLGVPYDLAGRSMVER
jgi:phosphopentomutase